MSESLEHIELVIKLEKWIKINFLNVSTLWIDKPVEKKPRQVSLSGFIPDYYGEINNPSRDKIVGEAKTPRDLQSKHSKQQIIEFMLYCNKYKGSKFILIVPYQYKAFAKNFIKYLMKENKIDSISAQVISNID